jgi:uncharacterized protein (TIGR01777 family)
MKVVIAGGTGFIGRNLVKYLVSAGHNVTVVSRRAAANRLTETVTWDQLVAEGAPSCDAVVNLCGENVFQPRFLRMYNEDYKHDMRNSRIGTTNMLCAALNKSGVKPRKFLAASAIGIYTTDEDREFPETAPLPPVSHDFMRQLLHDVEAAVTRVGHRASCDAISLRVGLVLGNDGGMFQQLTIPFSLGLGGNFGDGSHPMPWIHIADMCGIVQFLLEHDTPVNGPVNCVAPATNSANDFTRCMSKSPAVYRYAKGVSFLHTPRCVVNLLFGEDRAKHIFSRATVVPQYLTSSGFQFRYSSLEKCVNDIALE